MSKCLQEAELDEERSRTAASAANCNEQLEALRAGLYEKRSFTAASAASAADCNEQLQALRAELDEERSCMYASAAAASAASAAASNAQLEVLLAKLDVERIRKAEYAAKDEAEAVRAKLDAASAGDSNAQLEVKAAIVYTMVEGLVVTVTLGYVHRLTDGATSLTALTLMLGCLRSLQTMMTQPRAFQVATFVMYAVIFVAVF